MSKASEYAARCAEELGFRWENSIVALVSKSGDLAIGGCILPPERALALGHWLVDTFGEASECKHDRRYFQDSNPMDKCMDCGAGIPTRSGGLSPAERLTPPGRIDRD